jgi:hypothetical protein
MNNKTIWLIIAAVLCGVIAGYCDLHTDEVIAAAFLILVFTFILGFLDPGKAWLYSLIIGSSILVTYALAGPLNIVPKDTNVKITETLIALIPAFIGGYTGALTRYAVVRFAK